MLAVAEASKTLSLLGRELKPREKERAKLDVYADWVFTHGKEVEAFLNRVPMTVD